jgi:beta-glucosidase
LRVKFRKGLFERPYTGPRTLDPIASTALAREAAARCCVLVKNQGEVLPLRPGIRTVAVIGPLADDQVDMLGCWSGLGRWDEAVTLKKGLAAVLPKVRVASAKGCEITGGDRTGIDSAVALARGSDVVILALGEAALMSGENNFRLDLGLPGYQQELFDRVAALQRPLITILLAGRPLAVPSVMKKSAAVLIAWHPGTQAGTGIADLLTGVTAPSGRLTTSVPRSVGQVPVYYNYLRTGRPLDDYKDGTREPLLRFGYGLTYTQFQYSPTRLSSDTLKQGSLTASATLTNVGHRIGTEVAQLYLSATACSFGVRPVRELKGYRRVTLRPGEKKEVSFTLSPADLGAVTPDGQWLTESGRYGLVIAPDSGSGELAGFTLLPGGTNVTNPHPY